MTRCLKVLGQRSVVIYKTVTGATAIGVAVYASSGGVQALNKTTTLSGGQIASFISDGYIQLDIADILNGTLDGWYDLVITVTGGAYAGIDSDAGFGYTVDVTNKLYSRITVINPVSPTFSVSQVFHTAKMLLDEMNMLENLSVPVRAYQFDKRMLILKEILGYG